MDLKKPDDYGQIPLPLAATALGAPCVTHSLYFIYLRSYFLAVNPLRILLVLFFYFPTISFFPFSSPEVQTSRFSGSYRGKPPGASLTDKTRHES